MFYGGKMERFFKLIMALIGVESNFYGAFIPIVINGNGLYEDKYEVERYVYKGNNPNNYIKFNNELWRILSFDKGGIKLIRNEVLADMAFDDKGSNDFESSSLNKYLKNNYLNSIETNYRKMVETIELISLKEFLEVNSNQLLCGNFNLYFKNEKVCYKSNYINYIASGSINKAVWTTTADDGGINGVFYVGNTYFGDINSSYNKIGVLPVVVLNSSIRLYGKGTLHNPFKISL